MSRHHGTCGNISRRAVLAGLGTSLVGVGGASLLYESGAFSSAEAQRGVNVSTTSDSSKALVGLDVFSPVQKNQQDPLVTVTNNTNLDLDFTVSLQDCSDGTLYDPQGDSGCSVTFPLSDGSSGTVDIEAAVTGTIPFDVDVDSSAFDFHATRTTEGETGNVTGAVQIKKVQGFSANLTTNDWTIDQVHVQDGDGDNDLDRVEYEITDSGGNTRATRTDNATGKQYKEQNITIQPDDSTYLIQPGEQYTLTVTAYDVDGNFDTETRQDTA